MITRSLRLMSQGTGIALAAMFAVSLSVPADRVAAGVQSGTQVASSAIVRGVQPPHVMNVNYPGPNIMHHYWP